MVSWAGTRGVVPLAAALSIPLTSASGAPLPQRDCADDDAIDRAGADLQARVGRASARIDGTEAAEPDGLTDRELRRALNGAEHAELARLYDDGTISQPGRQRLERGLDLEAARLGDDQHCRPLDSPHLTDGPVSSGSSPALVAEDLLWRH